MAKTSQSRQEKRPRSSARARGNEPSPTVRDETSELARTPAEQAERRRPLLALQHGNAEMVREILRYHPQLELSCDHGITGLGSALHGSMNGWHRDTGDYVSTVEALLSAGARAPKVTDDLEASEPVRKLLNEYLHQ
jgi:hypothetical protein